VQRPAEAVDQADGAQVLPGDRPVPGQRGVGVRDRPAPVRCQGLGLLPRVREQLAPELAHRLEHAVPHALPRVAHGEQRLVHQRPDRLHRVRPEHRLRRVEGEPGPRCDRTPAEQLGRVAGAQLGERVDALGRDGERGPARGEDAQVRGGRDEERHQVGHGLDDVLAVVEDQQRGRPAEVLRDAGPHVGALGGGEGAAGARRVAHAQRRPDLADDVLTRRDAHQLDDVHHRLLGPAADGVRQPGLADPTRPDDRGDAGGAQQRAHRGEVGVAAEQRRVVEAQAGADRPVEGEQLGVHAPQPRAGLRPEPIEELPPVGRVPLERGAGAADRRLAAQERGEQLLVGRAGRRGGRQHR
jgi:hypothetical protein